VITSGGDQVYPRGLPVGVIESMAPDPDHQPYMAIRVKPAVNLDRIEEVLVITGAAPDLPAGAQQDLAAAVAQHAADVSAERLPGLHEEQSAPGADGSAPDAAKPADGLPVPSKTPKPLPALHPDRFTPGTVPPAADMTPGAEHGAITSPAPVEKKAPSDGTAPRPDAPQ
jgi:rod shape-determining protein MreC